MLSFPSTRDEWQKNIKWQMVRGCWERSAGWLLCSAGAQCNTQHHFFPVSCEDWGRWQALWLFAYMHTALVTPCDIPDYWISTKLLHCWRYQWQCCNICVFFLKAVFNLVHVVRMIQKSRSCNSSHMLATCRHCNSRGNQEMPLPVQA